MFSLFEFADISYQAFVLFLLTFEGHATASDVSVLFLGFLLLQFAEFSLVMIILFLVLVSLFRQIKENPVVHIDIFDLPPEVNKDLAVLFYYFLVSSHVILHALEKLGHLAAVIVQDVKGLSDLLGLDH